METKSDYPYKFNDNRVLYFENEEIRDIYVKINDEFSIYVYEDPCDGVLIKSHKNEKYIGDLLISMGFTHEEDISNRGKKFHHFIKGSYKFTHRDMLELYNQKGETRDYTPVLYSNLNEND